LFNATPVGNVLEGAGDELAIFGSDAPDAAQFRPEAPSGPGNHLGLDGEGGAVGPGLAQQGLDARNILFGVIAQPVLESARRTVQRVLAQAIDFLGPQQHVGLWVGLPAADVGDALGFVEEHR
jgi:hypothetical protein